MNLTTEALAQIADWEPTQQGFGREDPQTRIRIETIVDDLNSSGVFGCHVLGDDGLSNYFKLFTFVVADVPSFAFARKVQGVLMYLSASAPVGAAGRLHRCVAPGLTYNSGLTIEDLIDPQSPVGALEVATFKAIHKAGYELLTAAEAGAPLPPHIKPLEYCLGIGPHDRVFDALFTCTD